MNTGDYRDRDPPGQRVALRYGRRDCQVDIEDHLAVLTSTADFNWVDSITLGPSSKKTKNEGTPEASRLARWDVNGIPEPAKNVHEPLALFGSVCQESGDQIQGLGVLAGGAGGR